MPEEFFDIVTWSKTLSRIRKLKERAVNGQLDAKIFAEELEQAYEYLESLDQRVSDLEN